MYCPACGHQNLPGLDSCGNCLLSLTHLDDPVPHDRVERSLMTDPVTLLAQCPAVTLDVAATLGEAIRRMTEQAVGAVLLTDPDGRLLGILTERDFLAKAAGQPGFAGLPARQFMTPNPETVSTADTLAFALFKMDAGGYRHLPVVDADKPVGMLSIRDILRHLAKLCEE